MECDMAKSTVEVERLISNKRIQTQITAEAAVPGAGREAIEVLMEQADISVDSATPQEDAVAVEANLYCQAVYRQGDNYAAKAVTAQTRFSDIIDMPGVNGQSMVRARGVVEYVKAVYENGRMKFEVSVALQVQARQLDAVDIITGIEGVEGVETRCEKITSVKLAAESEASATVTEEVALPAQLDARVALMDWAEARLVSCEPDLGGVKVQGEICSQTLIGTGVSSRPLAMVKVVTPFEQTVEIPEWLANDVSADIEARNVQTGIQPSDGEEGCVLRIEGTAVVNVRADHEDAVNAVCDAYATKDSALDVKSEDMVFAVGKKTIDCSEQFRGTIMLNEDAPGVGTVLATRADPVISQWNAENGVTTVEGAIDIKSLYLPSGSEKVTSVRGELPFSFKCEGEWPQDAWVRISAAGCEAAALMSDRLEIRLTLAVSGFYRLTKNMTVAVNAQTSERAKGKSGIIIYWPNKSDDAWSVAKRYALPLSTVREPVESGVAIVLEV